MKHKAEINGKEYTFQKLPVKQAFELRNSCMDSRGGVDQAKIYKMALEHLVIHPRVSIEDFEEVWELDEVVGEALDFQYSKKQ